jgi:hypothetical protein
LCDARIDVAGDERAAAVAVDYLARAGVSLSRDDARTIAVGDATVLQATAGAAALVDCAAWLQGAFAAVEAIKQIAGVGSASALDPQLVLSEVRWRALP